MDYPKQIDTPPLVETEGGYNHFELRKDGKYNAYAVMRSVNFSKEESTLRDQIGFFRDEFIDLAQKIGLGQLGKGRLDAIQVGESRQYRLFRTFLIVGENVDISSSQVVPCRRVRTKESVVEYIEKYAQYDDFLTFSTDAFGGKADALFEPGMLTQKAAIDVYLEKLKNHDEPIDPVDSVSIQGLDKVVYFVESPIDADTVENDFLEYKDFAYKIFLDPLRRMSSLHIDKLMSVMPEWFLEEWMREDASKQCSKPGNQIRFGKYGTETVTTYGKNEALFCLTNGNIGVAYISPGNCQTATDVILKGIIPNLQWTEGLGNVLKKLLSWDKSTLIGDQNSDGDLIADWVEDEIDRLSDEWDIRL